MEDAELRAWLALNCVPGVGPTTFFKLIETFGSAQKVFQASKADFLNYNCKEKLADNLLNPPWDVAEKEIKIAKQKGIQFISSLDDSYPKALQAIAGRPPILYALGNLQALTHNQNFLAVVGSRQTTAYGVNNCKNFIPPLTANAVTIVSGFARGIDIVAHVAAVESGGYTVAVLGSGLGQIYPVENVKYLEKILDRGVLLSEFSYNTEARPEYFPRRNRIVSGMSRGVLVVEAAEKSGALITAGLAAEQGRDVFAIPGSILNPLTTGPHQLIQQGAKLVSKPEDILSEWHYPSSKVLESKAPKQTELFTPKKIEDANWQIIFDFCLSESQTPDEISVKTGLASHVLMGILTHMELAGHLKKLSGNRYISHT